jgi:tRNA1Val (adenine37-N6)-methyltransferase
MIIRDEKVFRFKHFEINQADCAMKVGTDGVLLGAWTAVKDAKHVLDIGTGTGLLALMIAQKSTAAIDAIEINRAAYFQALKNIDKSDWRMRINPVHASLQEYVGSGKKYDLIISNPPFFINAHKSTYDERNIARHTDESLSFDALIDGVISLLDEKGRFCLILPMKESQIFLSLCEKKGMYCQQLIRVKTKEGKGFKRVLLELSLIQPVKIVTKDISIHNEIGTYTREYIALTEDYYTHFSKRN